jgi:hypothetical protein
MVATYVYIDLPVQFVFAYFSTKLRRSSLRTEPGEIFLISNTRHELHPEHAVTPEHHSSFGGKEKRASWMYPEVRCRMSCIMQCSDESAV